MKSKIFLAALGFSMLSACSSLVSKSDYPVTISSSPESATFVIVDKRGRSIESGRTPATVILKSSSGYFSGQTYTIALGKEGYERQHYELKSTVDGWYWGNILIGGLLGMLIVDPATGAMYRLPDRVDISLQPSASAAIGNTLEFGTLDSLSGEQIARLEKLH